jgi:uncharacterized protein
METPKLFFDKEKLVAESDKAVQGKSPVLKSDLPDILFDTDNLEAYEKIFSNVTIIDAHGHIGKDLDGHGIDEKTFISQMKSSHINKSIVFPLNEPMHGDFSKANDRIFEFNKSYPDNIIPFFRLDPKTEWQKEYEKRVSQGFRGVKLHPRSQSFGLASEIVMELYGKAEKDNIPLLIHTGFGLDSIADDIEKVTKTFPKLRIILGHSAFVDLENTMNRVGKNNNVLFDTSTLGIFDLLQLINTLDYTKIVFGSDVPYFDFDISLEMLVDTAIICNKNPTHIKAILGGNIQRWFK